MHGCLLSHRRDGLIILDKHFISHFTKPQSKRLDLVVDLLLIRSVPEEGEDVLHVLDDGLGAEGRHGVVEDDGDAVVEERLSEDEEVELHVDADLLEDGEHGHRVHRRDQRRERQARRRVQLADYPAAGEQNYRVKLKDCKQGPSIYAPE